MELPYGRQCADRAAHGQRMQHDAERKPTYSNVPQTKTVERYLEGIERGMPAHLGHASVEGLSMPLHLLLRFACSRPSGITS
jgi:hypothetical protein